jgi:AcrR family transcriptional regulator
MSPRADVSEERKAQIIQAAMICLARQGYRQTTMDDIVRESGLSKGTLYWYFPSKDDLFLAILDVWMGELAQAIGMPVATDPTAQRLQAWVSAFTRFAQADPDRVRLIIEFWAEVHRSRGIEERLGQVYEERALLLAGIVRQGIERGELRAVDATSVAHAFLAVYDGLLLQQILMPDHFSWEQLNRLAIDTLLHGLLAPGAGGERVDG